MKSQRASNRITITGASGVGKTSLARLLGEKIDLAVVPELARELCHQMGYRNPTEIPDQEQFRKKLLEMQINHESSESTFISDRGTIDCWALWQRWNICTAMSYDTESYYELCRVHAQKTYTHVVYVPPLFEPEEDQFRWTDPDYIKQIDRLIRCTLYDWDLWDRTYTITSSDLDARAEEVTRWLANHV